MAIMCFFAIAIAYVMRVCLSVAITEMVAKPNQTEMVSTSNHSICMADPDVPGTSTGSVGVYVVFHYEIKHFRHFGCKCYCFVLLFQIESQWWR